MDRADDARLRVTVACTPSHGCAEEVRVEVRRGATLHDAICASGLLDRHPQLDPLQQAVGVWGRVRSLESPVCDGDRVELYRPLEVDPKDARRRRHALQRAATCSPRR